MHRGRDQRNNPINVLLRSNNNLRKKLLWWGSRTKLQYISQEWFASTFVKGGTLVGYLKGYYLRDCMQHIFSFNPISHSACGLFVLKRRLYLAYVKQCTRKTAKIA